MDIPYYLKIGKAPDVESLKERIIYRALEIFPGALVWFTLIGMFILSWLVPVYIAFFIIGFCLYWLLRTLYFSTCLTLAYKELYKNLNIDWLEKLNELSSFNPKLKIDSWKDIYHLIIFPMYKENIEIARGSFQALVDCHYPKDKMIVVLGIEKRAGEEAKKTAQEIEKEFGGKFYRFLVTEHPNNIPGEIAGKGSNECWAGRYVKEKIIDREKILYEKIIVSSFDIDTQVYPHYFSCLTHHYLTDSEPFRSSFQPIPLYLNNLEEAPFFSRVVSSCNVFWQMIQQQRPEKLVTYSSHSMSFKALIEMDFWQSNVVSEDAGIFWKSFLFFDGNYKVIPLHYPISQDNCVAKTLKQTIINQYKQQRRWAWGSEGIPYLLFGFFKNKQISFRKKFHYAFLLIEGCWAWGTNALIILFLGWLPIVLGGEKFQESVLSYNLPGITGNLMKVALVGVIIFMVINTLLINSRAFYFGRWKNLFILSQWLFLPFSLIIFGTIPAIDAQTRLMLGKYMGFWVTEKARFKKPV
ncbi:MAG: hypothetical protein WBC21_01610 [Minisyncoccales bacterium]